MGYFLIMKKSLPKIICIGVFGFLIGVDPLGLLVIFKLGSNLQMVIGLFIGWIIGDAIERYKK